MIYLFSGIPGSGKSYKMVAELLKNAGKKFIIHNVDGLNPDILQGKGFHFEKYCQENGMEVTEFFSKEYQGKICDEVQKKYEMSVLVIIDESTEWFDRQVKTLKLWLAYHRHYGQEVWLVAHKCTNLSPSYRSYIEVEYRAKTGSLLFLPGLFMYQRISGGTPCGYIFERKKKEVFAAYKSTTVGAPKAKRSFLVPALIVLCCIGIYGFIHFPQWLYGKKVPVKTSVAQPMGSNMAAPVDPLSSKGSTVPPSIIGGPVPIDEKYAFCGTFNGCPVFEDRSTGQQLRLEALPREVVVMAFKGSDYIKLFDPATGKLLTLTSWGRGQRGGRNEGRVTDDLAQPSASVIAPIL